MNKEQQKQVVVLAVLVGALAVVMLVIDPFGLFEGGGAQAPAPAAAPVENTPEGGAEGATAGEGEAATPSSGPRATNPEVPEVVEWTGLPGGFQDPWMHREPGTRGGDDEPALVPSQFILRWVEFEHKPGQRMEEGDEVTGTDDRLYVIRRIDSREQTVTVMDEDGRVFTFSKRD